MKNNNAELDKIIEELDSFSVNPAEIEYADKVINTYIYNNLDEAALTEFSGLSGRIIQLETDIHSLKRNVVAMMKVGNHYINALQELGAFTAKSISQNVDYVVLSKNPEVMINESSLAKFVWEKGPQEGDYYTWLRTFKSTKDKYENEIQEYFIKKYKEELESIKDASEKRVSKKSNQLVPVGVIWEDQLYEYFKDKQVLFKSPLKWKMKVGSIRGGDFDRMIPFIEDGKSVEMLIKLKKGTQDEIDEAIDYLNSCKNNVKSIASVEKEPEVNGDIVTMTLRSLNGNLEDGLKNFAEEDLTKRSARAIKMFKSCVEAIENAMDMSGDYVQPTIMGAIFKGKIVPESDGRKDISGFLSEIKKWMDEHGAKYDFEYSSGSITNTIEQYYNDALFNNNIDADGLAGVCIPVGLAIAYINYVAPYANIEFEFGHDKWEYRGDYTSAMRLGFIMYRSAEDYSIKVDITENEYEETKM